MAEFVNNSSEYVISKVCSNTNKVSFKHVWLFTDQIEEDVFKQEYSKSRDYNIINLLWSGLNRRVISIIKKQRKVLKEKIVIVRFLRGLTKWRDISNAPRSTMMRMLSSMFISEFSFIV